MSTDKKATIDDLNRELNDIKMNIVWHREGVRRSGMVLLFLGALGVIAGVAMSDAMAVLASSAFATLGIARIVEGS
jgi:hypothetical protein